MVIDKNIKFKSLFTLQQFEGVFYDTDGMR